MRFHTLIVDTTNGIATITVNRPYKLNALNELVFSELDQVLDQIRDRSDIQSALITGSGDKAFVAGADISELAGLDARSGEALAKRGQRIFDRIENSPKIIAAAVNGFALGGGCELAMACHFRVAVDHAKFGQPEVNLGLLPGYGGTQRLTQLVGKGRALELLVTGNMIDSVTAFKYGLVNHVVPADQLIPTTKSILSVINTKAPLAIAQCVRAVQDADAGDRRGYAAEAVSFGQLLETEDAREGIAAFLGKRKPVFKGR